MQTERTDRDPGRLPRMIAEALVHRHPMTDVHVRVRSLGVSEQVAAVLARLCGATGADDAVVASTDGAQGSLTVSP